MWRIAIAVLIGHCCLHSLGTLPQPFPWAWIVLGTACIGVVVRWPWLVALALGFCWAWWSAAARLDAELAPALEGQDLVLRGAIASIPDAGPDPSFLLDVHDAAPGVPQRARITWYGADPRPAPGEVWQLEVRLKRRNGFANPGGFDYEGHLFRQGIGAVGYVREGEHNRMLQTPAKRYLVLRARAYIARQIAAAVPHSTVLGILQGLSVGETQAMRAEQWQVFAATGTTHLMAISGLHISMLAMLAAALGRQVVRLRFAQLRRITAVHGEVICGVTAAMGYSLLAGLSIPTQRTLVMLCMYFAARLVRRRLSVGQGLSWALLAVLLIDPFAPLAPGAWLSFGAVAVILIVVAGRVHAMGTVKSFAYVQWAITLGLVPLLIGLFGSVSLISPLANAVAVPAFTCVLVPLVLAGTLLATLTPALGHPLLACASWLLEQSWPLLEHLAAQPLALWYMPELPIWMMLMLLASACLLICPGLWSSRFAGCVLCLPALLYRPAAPLQGEFNVAVLDVGQGLSVVVRTRSHVLVYDLGPAFRSGRDVGEMVIAPYLRRQGVRRLDGVVISHGDLDHRGGWPSLHAAFPIDAVWTGPSFQLSSVPAQTCEAGQRWRWDDVEFQMLHPPSGLGAAGNESSCVLRIVGVGGSVLLTGDIERFGERALLEASVPPTDVVIVPHHGSRTSSSAPFVAALQAQLAIFSAGYRNRWGMPREDVVTRWREGGADTLSTIDSGAIEIAVTVAGVTVLREYRVQHARYWHR